MAAGARHSRNSQTANLHRFVQLNDRFETQIFTFIAPTHLSKGFLNETFSRDFVYGNQKWCVHLTRNERNVGSFLILKNALSGMTVKVDYSFTVLNRDHFTRNESFAEKAVCFTAERNSHGRATFIGAADLGARNFLFDDSRFLIELELRNPVTEYREETQLPRDQRELHNLDRLETSYFTFGSCDWNLAVYLQSESSAPYQQQYGSTGTAADGPMLVLQRHSRFEHWCRVRYRAIFHWGDKSADSGPLDQLLDVKGDCHGHRLETRMLQHLSTKHPLRVELDLLSMCPIALVDLLPTSRNKNCARCYDTDKQEWIVESDILGRVVKLRLYYADVRNVPRHFTRLVCWSAYLMPNDRSKAPVRACNGPFCCYYSQKENDEGFEMAFDLPVEEICDNNAGYTDPETGYLTAQIEWLHSHLLYHDFYHQYDDVSRVHKHQMSREIMALQAENYALEKQVYNYQQHVGKIESGEPVPGGVMGSVPQSHSHHTSVPLLSTALGAVGALTAPLSSKLTSSQHNQSATGNIHPAASNTNHSSGPLGLADRFTNRQTAPQQSRSVPVPAAPAPGPPTGMSSSYDSGASYKDGNPNSFGVTHVRGYQESITQGTGTNGTSTNPAIEQAQSGQTDYHQMGTTSGRDRDRDRSRDYDTANSYQSQQQRGHRRPLSPAPPVSTGRSKSHSNSQYLTDHDDTNSRHQTRKNTAW